MAHHLSAIKRAKISLVQKRRNTIYKSMLKTKMKKVLSIKDKNVIQEELKSAYSLVDKLAAKGIIHKNKAANKKSKLTQYANSLK
ncbi:MAG: 30S ribosomal protein S20 [candidate division KSB1 bacterium]|nr:30S ribosomal protein S20 [candidate division KSB1 bacterium]MDZ7317660.1 30S ribosomal protein S20 [candidate division KSB1 bacterium]